VRLDPTLKQRAKAMRANPTPAEYKLWLALRANRLDGWQFTRQTVIDRYIVDFASKAAGLVIEVDGDTHSAQESYDSTRTERLAELGFKVMRFGNGDVMNNLDGVLMVIEAALRHAPSPQPSPRGGREL
jgi:very-short-patch-repair endonuclease